MQGHTGSYGVHVGPHRVVWGPRGAAQGRMGSTWGRTGLCTGGHCGSLTLPLTPTLIRTLNDLGTVMEHQLPIKMAIMNDKRQQMVRVRVGVWVRGSIMNATHQ